MIFKRKDKETEREMEIIKIKKNILYLEERAILLLFSKKA